MEQPQELFSLSLDADSKSQLIEAGRWARILAICGTIFLLLVVGGIIIQLMAMSRLTGVFGRESSQGLMAGAAIAYLIMLVIVFFPLLYLFRFSGKIKTAIEANDQQGFNESLRYIKIYFRYLGIITIIGLTIFALSFFITLVGRTTV